jgi:phosphoribosyl-ATP pyrophosphohydrolase/phosphoribosyl-AMP cyclohydrolase
MTPTDLGAIDWGKGEGLVPAIVQHADSGAVLMLGYMNREALEATLATRHVTFFSRSRGRLWTKGETSGNVIALESVVADCDRDTLLVRGRPAGPVCHTGTATCFGADGAGALAFLGTLESVIDARLAGPADVGYTAKLAAGGTKRIAQKVGEEGLEVALAAVAGDEAELISESADLVFHLLVLLRTRDKSLRDVAAELARRHTPKP